MYRLHSIYLGSLQAHHVLLLKAACFWGYIVEQVHGDFRLIHAASLKMDQQNNLLTQEPYLSLRDQKILCH